MVSTCDQIIATTCDLPELQGYHATGLNQIIKESGSPKGSLYYYFPGGKEELAVEAVSYGGKIVLERIRENLAQLDDAAAAIHTFIRNIANQVERSGFRAGGRLPPSRWKRLPLTRRSARNVNGFTTFIRSS